MNQLPINRIEKQLLNYLDQKTNYAIMLTGSWGAGKTHYLKNIFFPKLDSTHYHGITVSLFGITNIDEIKDRIFLELYPIVKNKHLNASGSVLKLLLKSLDVTSVFGNGLSDGIFEAQESFKEQRFDFIKLEKLLICFDDLERADPALLNANQIFGFINSLVEDNNIKVLIVTNEGKNHIGDIKEKVIGTTIHFYQDYEEAFDGFVSGLTDETIPFKNHLQNNKLLIYSFLIKENNKDINYRTLSYFISYYGKVCHSVQKLFSLPSLNVKLDEILNGVLRFTLFVCIEYKKNKIDFGKTEGIEDGMSFRLLKLYESSTTQKPSNYKEEILELYFPDEDYCFYKSIFDYVTGGDFFNENELFKELSNQYHIIDQNISDPYVIFNQLNSQNFKELSDDKYILLTKKLRDYALQGEYLAEEYMQIFYCIVRYNNLLDLNISYLTKRLKSVIKKLNHQYMHEELLAQYYEPQTSNPFYEYVIQIYNVLVKVNNDALLNQNAIYDREIENLLVNDPDKLYKKMIEDLNKPFTRKTLSGIHPSVFYKTFKNADNATKVSIIRLFETVYLPHFGNNNPEDLLFIKELDELLSLNKNKHKSKSISTVHYEQLCRVVEKSKLLMPYG